MMLLLVNALLGGLSVILLLTVIVRLMRMSLVSNWRIRLCYVAVGCGALGYILAPFFNIQQAEPTLFYLLGLILLVLMDRRSRTRDSYHGNKEKAKAEDKEEHERPPGPTAAIRS